VTETASLTREVPCACGDSFEQRGLAIPFTDRVQWNPLRCPKCQTRISTQRIAEEQADRQRSVAENRRLALIRLAVPPEYEKADLDTFALWGNDLQQKQLDKIKDLARRYIATWPAIDDRRRLLLFQGPPGCGKGHVAWSLAQTVAKQHGHRVKVVKLAAIIRDVREAWRGAGGPSEDERLEHYRGLRLLVIDEVSRHAFYGSQVSQHLYDIVDDRLEQHRPTILTTNEDDEGIAEILGPALMSRLSGGGGVIRFPAVDWRARP
jgi:DNA replication protein DnaC